MSKLLSSENEWFQESVPRLEDNLETAVLAYLESLFPDYIATAFKQDLFNPYRKRKNAADLAMFKRDYTEWFIIEVELAKHDLDHVLEQIETFTSFTPTIQNADYVYNQRRKEFDKNKLRHCVTNVAPKTMVIVNDFNLKWKQELDKFGCSLCIFQVYKDFDSNRIYRISGDHPVISTNFTYCRLQKTVVGFIEILDTHFLDQFNILHQDSVEIVFNGKSSKWVRINAGNKVFLENRNAYSALDPDSSRYRLLYYSRERGKTKKATILGWFFRIKNPLPTIDTFTFIRD